MQFHSLNIIDPILRSLKEEGYTVPTPIQVQAIPVVLSGKDLLGSAQTGTGKTAAFAIPILQLLSENKIQEKKRTIRSLIVTPTRELALQIGDSFKAYGRHTGLTCTVVFGGVNQFQQTNALRHGVDILVATPGRLLDLINQRYISLKDIRIFVLDEADRMLDMGFIHDIKKIQGMLPPVRQSLFFSATMPPEILSLAGSMLNNPAQVIIQPVSPTLDAISQFLYYVDKSNKNALLMDVLKDAEIKTALVFTRTKHGADKVVRILERNNIKAEALHGNKSQSLRQRALSNFKKQHTRVLVATDIAARGLDVDNLGLVINYEIPNIAETYIHRIGRTGRAGAEGTSYSFCDSEEKKYLRDIERLIKKKITVIDDHPFPLVNHHPVKAVSQERVYSTQSGHSSRGSGQGSSRPWQGSSGSGKGSSGSKHNSSRSWQGSSGSGNGSSGSKHNSSRSWQGSSGSGNGSSESGQGSTGPGHSPSGNKFRKNWHKKPFGGKRKYENGFSHKRFQ